MLNYLTVLVCTKTIIHLSVGGQWWLLTSLLRIIVIQLSVISKISKNQDSHIQAAVGTLASLATEDKFQLNLTKCKELHINFNTNNPTSFDPVVVNGMPFDLVTSAKILGLNISNDLKWNCHIDSIIKKAKKRLYTLSQLKRSGLGTRELVQFL